MLDMGPLSSKNREEKGMLALGLSCSFNPALHNCWINKTT